MIHPKICASMMAACIMAPLLSAAQSSAPQSSAPSQSSATQTAPPRKRITHQALWMMKRVGAPVVSPDGKWVVYSVLEPAYEPDKAVSDLWVVPTDGQKPPRRITNTKPPEDDVAWSLDSTRIAFSTKREGDDVEQIYILDLAGGG